MPRMCTGAIDVLICQILMLCHHSLYRCSGAAFHEWHHIHILSVVKAWVGLTAAKIARAVRVCTRHRMLCTCGLLNTATLMFTIHARCRVKVALCHTYVALRMRSVVRHLYRVTNIKNQPPDFEQLTRHA